MIATTIHINRNQTATLPIQLGDTVIYRDTDILVIRSNNGFQLNCNLQFDLCWFELSGWYFGKTAGLLVTMNNEIYDDSLTTQPVVERDANAFKNSSSLEECRARGNRCWASTFASHELIRLCRTTRNNDSMCTQFSYDI